MAKILIVDDSAFIRMILRDTLSKNGYRDLYEVCNSLQALDIYEVIHPDLVLMDIMIPNMDGLETLREIRKIDPKAKVVMLSAYGQEAMANEAIKIGAKGFIVKPFEQEEVLDTVRINL